VNQKRTVQNILSIDASVNPPQVFLFEVEGVSCTLRERYSLDCDPSELLSYKSNSHRENESLVESNGNAALVPVVKEIINPLIHLKAQIQSSWEYLAIVIPPDNLISLNLALPFSSQKAISQVLQGEVQEQLPLDADSFHIHFDIQGPFRSSAGERSADAGNLVEVKVQLIEQSAIESILAITREVGMEPTLITTPGSLLPLALNIAGRNNRPLSNQDDQPEERPHAIIDCQEQHLTMAIFADGAYRNEYTFETKSKLGSMTSHLIRNVRWAEQRYNCTIDPIYVIGLPSEREVIQSALNRKVHPLLLPARVPHHELIGMLAAIAAQEDPPGNKPSNLRSGPYTYNPLLTFAIGKLIGILPTLIITLISLIGISVAVYLFREYEIDSYQKALSRKIQAIAPELNAPAGTEAAALRGRIRQFDEQLKAMSIFSDLTPLDVLGLVFKYIPPQDDVEINYISVEGRNITLRGSARDHATVEKVTRELKKNGRTFCKLRKQRAMKSSQKTISFEFQFEMCE